MQTACHSVVTAEREPSTGLQNQAKSFPESSQTANLTRVYVYQILSHFVKDNLAISQKGESDVLLTGAAGVQAV